MKPATSVLALILSVAAQAQIKPAAGIAPLVAERPEPIGKAEAGVIRKNFASCMYRKAPEKAQLLLEHSDMGGVDLAGAKIKSVTSDFKMDKCLARQAGDANGLGLRFSWLVLRDLLAEEAYLARNATAPSLPATPTPLAATFVSRGEALPRAQQMMDLADCVAIHDLAAADALLRTTTPASAQESVAARALAPALAACLVQGQTVSLTPGSIRAFVAFAMWNRFARSAAR